ncbi:hypothetical protein N1851_030330 [Merluccius polli]|uniref:Uncharacterized protein n=1 Tax=Merluccius polli TaxID=89951 RepID=A0AA47M5T7_MERPO|nr:hypothetical protein N1851_030330 [Merluccius polli]
MIVPTSTRWNSFYDALSRISDIPAQDLNTLCTRLDIRAPTEREHLFLKEYCSVLEPLTIVLDILQGDSYYGALLPTLETLMSRTLALQNGLSRMTADLPGVIVQGLPTEPDELKFLSHCAEAMQSQTGPGSTRWHTPSGLDPAPPSGLDPAPPAGTPPSLDWTRLHPLAHHPLDWTRLHPLAHPSGLDPAPPAGTPPLDWTRLHPLAHPLWTGPGSTRWHTPSGLDPAPPAGTPPLDWRSCILRPPTSTSCAVRLNGGKLFPNHRRPQYRQRTLS